MNDPKLRGIRMSSLLNDPMIFTKKKKSLKGLNSYYSPISILSLFISLVDFLLHFLYFMKVSLASYLFLKIYALVYLESLSMKVK